MNHSEIVSFIWGVADLIRDTFKWDKYQDIILPLTVLRRLDCVLAPTKPRVLNTAGGDLLIGVADDGSVTGIEQDRFENDDEFMRHLAQAVRNGLGDRAGTCIDPKTQIVQGKTVCLVSCQRSPEAVFLKWKGTEEAARGDFFVGSGPGSVKLSPESAAGYIKTRLQK